MAVRGTHLPQCGSEFPCILADRSTQTFLACCGRGRHVHRCVLHTHPRLLSIASPGIHAGTHSGSCPIHPFLGTLSRQSRTDLFDSLELSFHIRPESPSTCTHIPATCLCTAFHWDTYDPHTRPHRVHSDCPPAPEGRRRRSPGAPVH